MSGLDPIFFATREAAYGPQEPIPTGRQPCPLIEVHRPKCEGEMSAIVVIMQRLAMQAGFKRDAAAIDGEDARPPGNQRSNRGSDPQGVAARVGRSTRYERRTSQA